MESNALCARRFGLELEGCQVSMCSVGPMRLKTIEWDRMIDKERGTAEVGVATEGAHLGQHVVARGRHFGGRGEAAASSMQRRQRCGRLRLGREKGTGLQVRIGPSPSTDRVGGG